MGKDAGSVQACAVAHARNAQDVSTLLRAVVVWWCGARCMMGAVRTGLRLRTTPMKLVPE